MFGFCMARILTLTLRIVWARFPHDVSIAIAANIFVSAGILIMYILNLLFASRIIRALQPTVGWHPALRIFFKVLYALIGCSLALVIVLTVMSSYTLDPKIKHEALWIQRGAVLYMFIFTLVPACLLAVALLLPKHTGAEEFGHGSMKTKIIILALGCCLTATISGFKLGESSNLIIQGRLLTLNRNVVVTTATDRQSCLVPLQSGVLLLQLHARDLAARALRARTH